MPTIVEHLREARRRLEAAGIPAKEAALDADVLARHALGGWERGQLLARQREPAPGTFASAYEPLVARRALREPAAYILGMREFWSLDFEVTRDTLVPRPETELVVEEALALTPPGPIRIADVCTGSGCLGVALARWLPLARVVATDLSAPALAVAARNAARHEVRDRVRFLRSDLLGAVSGRFDVIVSNPPYIPTADVGATEPEVRDHEPRLALDGGTDGLDLVRRLVPQAADRLDPGGVLIFEFGLGQADTIRAIVLADDRFALEAIRDDLAGIPRVAVIRRVSPPPAGPSSGVRP